MQAEDLYTAKKAAGPDLAVTYPGNCLNLHCQGCAAPEQGSKMATSRNHREESNLADNPKTQGKSSKAVSLLLTRVLRVQSMIRDILGLALSVT